MGTLFEIVGELQELYSLATDPECDPRALDDTIEGVMGMLQIKAGGYTNLIKQLEMEQKQAEEVADSFAKKAKVRANSIKKMKDALLMAMDGLEITELDAGDYKLKVQKNGGKEPLVIDDPGKVPDSLTKITIEPDKEKIRDYLKNHDVEWAHVEPRGRHIVIK